MGCKHCGEENTIKAHLVPRVFCKQVQAGKSHAALVVKNGHFQISQSGIWDTNILCAKCDGVLGTFENYVHRVAESIRANGSDVPGKYKVMNDIDSLIVLRFCSGILYKYSLTSRQNGGITLGRYQDILRRFIYGDSTQAPVELNAFIFRPLRYPNDNGLFAYRAPSPDRKFGVNIYRMMMGGLVFFVKLDRRELPDPSVAELLIRNSSGLRYLTTPVIGLEEFEMARDLCHTNQRLSDYLDKTPKEQNGV